jgi:hypothetical protein
MGPNGVIGVAVPTYVENRRPVDPHSELWNFWVGRSAVWYKFINVLHELLLPSSGSKSEI